MANNPINNNVREIVNDILSSPIFRSSVERAISENQSRNRLNNEVEELHSLFPSISPRVRQNVSSSAVNCSPSKSKKRKFKDDKDVIRDIILVKHTQTKTLTGLDKARAYAEGYAISAAVFNKNWEELEIKNCIRSLFDDKISSDFELLIPMSGQLIKPNLSLHTCLDGTMLARLFYQKPIYIRPVTNTVVSIDSIAETSAQILDGQDVNMSVLNSDEEFEKDTSIAIQKSLSETTTEINSLQDILQEIQSHIVEDNVTYFNIYREDIFSCCLRAIRRKTFSPYNKISVIFTDIDGENEGAIDAGGPTREMFRLLMKYFQNCRLFEGNEYDKIISLDNDALMYNEYFDAGRLIALSLVNGGPGPQFFSNHLFNCLTTEDISNLSPGICDVADINVREIIIAANNSTDLISFQKIVEENAVFSIAGCSYVSDFNKKQQIINDTIKFYATHRLRPALDQLINGLKTCDIISKIKKYPIFFKNVICYNTNNKLTSTKLRNMFICNLSQSGTNKRLIENKCFTFWLDYLLDCEESNDDCHPKLKDILIFTTGAEEQTPAEFSSLTLKFLHDEDCPYPKGNTCSLELHLPVVHNSYEEFKRAMNFGILNGMVFGYH